MKPKKAWIVLNKNGNPILHPSDCLFESKKDAEGMISEWLKMEGRAKNNPNNELTAHRVTIEVNARE